jgi:acyl carrier protein
VEDKNISLDDNLFEIGISSLALAEIHEAIDEAFPGKVEISDLFDNPTIRELSDFLQKAIA